MTKPDVEFFTLSTPMVNARARKTDMAIEIYFNASVPTARGSSGTVTTIANA